MPKPTHDYISVTDLFAGPDGLGEGFAAFRHANLIESYERIMAFVRKHLPDPFFLEGIDRISIRDAIFSEVASNILIHREYTNAFPAKLNIEYGQVRTENSNKPHGFGVLNPASFTPFPKNPVIGKFFRQIGRADELGSGMRKMMKYGKAYGSADPEMIEGDVFRIIVKVPEFQQVAGSGSQTGQLATEVEVQVTEQVEAQVEIAILTACAETPLSSAEIASTLGHKKLSGNLRKALPRMRNASLLEYTIPDKPNSRLQKYRLTAKGRKLVND